MKRWESECALTYSDGSEKNNKDRNWEIMETIWKAEIKKLGS